MLPLASKFHNISCLPGQEALLEENATIVRKIAQDIDQSIEQAQKRYKDATQEVNVNVLSPISQDTRLDISCNPPLGGCSAATTCAIYELLKAYRTL
eukprot:scaffold8025_cov20-Tisochrysis_lutea.AAC.1